MVHIKEFLYIGERVKKTPNKRKDGLTMEQQQQPQISLEEYKRNLQKEREQKELQEFKDRMIGKTYKELGLKEQNWLYQNHRLVYENLITDRSYQVPKFI